MFISGGYRYWESSLQTVFGGHVQDEMISRRWVKHRRTCWIKHPGVGAACAWKLYTPYPSISPFDPLMNHHFPSWDCKFGGIHPFLDKPISRFDANRVSRCTPSLRVVGDCRDVIYIFNMMKYIILYNVHACYVTTSYHIRFHQLHLNKSIWYIYIYIHMTLYTYIYMYVLHT